MQGGEGGFFEKCAEVAAYARSFTSPTIVHHYDCDGITSGSIAALGLKKDGKFPKMVTLRKLDDQIVNELFCDKNEIVFVDFGGGCKAIDQIKDAVVIDHHQTEGIATLQANPQLHGLDGGAEISAAGVAYFVFGQAEWLGVVGAVGDVQAPLHGLNGKLLEIGGKNKTVSRSNGLRLYGKGTRPLKQLLLYADDPYLPGISGNEEACSRIIESSGVEQVFGSAQRTYNDLNDEEKKKFVGNLVDALSQGRSQNVAQELFGESYQLDIYRYTPQLYEAAEFATLLNACGRNDKPQIGIGVCLGATGALQEAIGLLAAHRKNLQAGVTYGAKNIQDFGPFRLLDGRGVIDDGIIGVVAGMLMGGKGDRPMVALSLDKEGQVKVSGRAKKTSIDAGINLGAAMKAAALKAGGVGGGHAQAAGCTIPNDNVDAFLATIGGVFRSQANQDYKE
ncbi:DHH family phosphoesterase [Candidatus Parvarchaeota archaeon]|nr:DHH family phosphoesterase [Candidatus Parvarchaeota archaeon]